MTQMTRDQAEWFKSRMAICLPDAEVEIGNNCLMPGYFDGVVTVRLGHIVRSFYGSIRDAWDFVTPAIEFREMQSRGVFLD